MFDTL